MTFINKLKDSLVEKKKKFLNSLNILLNRELNDDHFEELLELLVKADVNLETSEKIINMLRKRKTKNHIKNELGIIMNNILEPCEKTLNVNSHKPFVILVIGVNGVGKTTTVVKLANLYKKNGKKVLIAAGDTFRAAGIEQLDCLSKKYNIPIIKKHSGVDSAAVIFNALEFATSKKFDILIADTSGRLHTNSNLMSDLYKINKSLKKIQKDAPHEIMMIIDATFGQNSIMQVKTFSKYINITGLTISKLDGTAKAGTIFSIADTLSIPIRYVCNGEKINNLHKFKSKDYINRLLEINL